MIESYLAFTRLSALGFRAFGLSALGLSALGNAKKKRPATERDRPFYQAKSQKSNA